MPGGLTSHPRIRVYELIMMALKFLMGGKDVHAPEGQNFHDGFPSRLEIRTAWSVARTRT